VKVGRVEHGSYLLIESLDRLSRQEITKALTLFLSIIDSGIVIVTLADQRTYEPGKVELTELIVSLVTMSRSHEESKMKSQRVAAAWESKRKGATTKPITAKCPTWLTLRDGVFVVDEERAAVVRAMYEDHTAGMGILHPREEAQPGRRPAAGHVQDLAVLVRGQYAQEPSRSR